jgi:hypothetical protein
MRAKFPWGKFLLGYALYLFFHEADRFLPGTLGVIFGEGFESVYAHMKMLFYAYLILSIIDFFRLRNQGLPGSFFYARMLILAAVPWMMIATYYSLEAMGIMHRRPDLGGHDDRFRVVFFDPARGAAGRAGAAPGIERHDRDCLPDSAYHLCWFLLPRAG